MEIGTRVRINPNSPLSFQQKGIGTIKSDKSKDGWYIVAWKSGYKNSYKDEDLLIEEQWDQ